MATYTRAILQLIDENPGISTSEIDRRLGLEGRHVEGLIRPYVRSGHILINKVPVEGERKLFVTFSAVGQSVNVVESSQRCSYEKWTPKDLETLVSLYPDHSNSAIAKRLERTLKQVKSKARKLKLYKSEETIEKLSNPTHWSTQDIQILRNLYAEKPISALADLLGKSDVQVSTKAKKLRLKKSDAFWKNCGERLMSSRAGIQIKTEPIGTEKIWDRYIVVKIRDPGIWELKQQIVWRAHRGQYNTKTHALWFIDRNPLNCDISNLELITKSEMMKRTSLMKYPKELRDVITLHNKLKRKLREQYRDPA